MKHSLFLAATLFLGGAMLSHPAPVQAQGFTKAAASELAGMPLPSNTLRFEHSAIPKEINDALQTMMQSGGPQVRRGRTEVLGWSGDGYKKSKAKEWKARIAAALQKGGWEYEEGEKIDGAQGMTMVSALKTSPSRKALIGFWAATDDLLVLAWTEMLPAQSGNGGIVPPNTPGNIAVPDPNDAPEKPETPVSTPATSANGAIVLEVKVGQFVVNVAKGLPEPKVSFPTLTPKPGKVRGYVFGTDGKPLQGAVIGVSSTAVGGAETSVTGKTDARGYYEMMVPYGGARFYTSGYTAEYGGGLLALGLTPADGDADEFATPKGHVENWILRPYGIADRAGVQDNPQYLNNYFGGSLTLYFLDENSGYAGPKGLPFGSTVEVILTPKGVQFDGSRGHTFTIRKVIKDDGTRRLHLNNIPIGKYHVEARMIHQGRTSGPLFLRETGYYSAESFGLEPKESQNGADVTFRPYSARASSTTATKGNWKEVGINIMQ